MKIKEGYLLREVAGNHVVIPAGKLDFDGMITLNETGVTIWKTLSKPCTREEIINSLLEEYDVSRETASQDVDNFLEKLREADLIDE